MLHPSTSDIPMTFCVSLGSRAVNLEFSQDPIVGPRCAAWQSRQRPSPLVVKLRIATEYILMHAATCCNVLQRAATIATGRIKFIDSICMCAAYIYVHKMLWDLASGTQSTKQWLNHIELHLWEFLNNLSPLMDQLLHTGIWHHLTIMLALRA